MSSTDASRKQTNENLLHAIKLSEESSLAKFLTKREHIAIETAVRLLRVSSGSMEIASAVEVGFNLADAIIKRAVLDKNPYLKED